MREYPKSIKRTGGQKKSIRGGFTLILAVLVASLLLAIGLAITNIALRELSLSSTARESQFSFYAADSAVECALYWDIQGKEIFATSTWENVPNPVDPTCSGQDFFATTVQFPSGNTREVNSAKTTFQLKYEKSCAVVMISKLDADRDGAPESTTVEARGRNVADCSGLVENESSVGMVERALRVRY